MPRSQTPPQHSPPKLHPKPSGVHEEKPQVPLSGSQKPLQHSALAAQNAPSGEHAVKPQAPLFGLQKALQHSAPVAQGSPSGRQIPAPQVPENGSQTPPQHSASKLQILPSGVQSSQMPSSVWQMPLQHWDVSLHPSPGKLQPHRLVARLQKPRQHCSSFWQNLLSGSQTAPTQKSSWQMLLQHWPLATQGALPPLHWAWPHRPFSQLSAQHAAPFSHGIPLGRHWPSPQISLVHCPLQHWSAVWQGTPSFLQTPPQTPKMQSWPQQSWFKKHAAPAGLHRSGALQTALLQSRSPQHEARASQPWPSARQALPTPLLPPPPALAASSRAFLAPHEGISAIRTEPSRSAQRSRSTIQDRIAAS